MQVIKFSGRNRLSAFIAILIFIPWSHANGTNDLFIENNSSGPGGLVTITVTANNSEPFNAFQFDILFPSELEWDEGVARLTSRSVDHTLSAILVAAGRLRVLAYSLTNSDFTGSSGSILELDFIAGVQPGSYPVTFENVTLSGVGGNILNSINAGTFTLFVPQATLSAHEIDYGRVPLLQEEFRTLTLTNTGNLDLTVSTLDVSDTRFSLSETLPFTLSPGNSRSINMRFYSTDKVVLDETLTISGNDPAGVSTCTMKAISYAVNELHVGSVLGRSGYEVEVPVTVNNMEEFSAVQFRISLPSTASYIGGSAILSDPRRADHIISADTSGNILTIIAYSPSNASFSGNDGNVMNFTLFLEGQGGSYALPVTEPIISSAAAGNIISASYDGVVTIAAPSISVNPGSIDFGNVSILESPTLELTVYNYGSDLLEVTGMSCEDAAFDILTEVPFTVLPGNNAVVGVRFENDVAGLHVSNLRIRHNDAVHDPLDIPMRAQSYVPNELRVIDCQAAAAMRDTVFIELYNQSQVIGFQFDIEYPDGLTVNPEEIFLTGRTQDHFVMASGIQQNKLRVLSYSGTLQIFTGTEGAVLGIPVLITSSLSGTYPLTVSEVVISDQSGGSVETGYASGNISILAATDQTINLTEGWNLVSFAVGSQETSFEDLLGSVMAADLTLKVQDEEGKAIEWLNDPVGWINEIGQWILTEGYKIRVSDNRSLIVKGQPAVLPMDIPLESGWNLTGYPSLTAQSASSVYGPLAATGALVKVQNETGAAVEQVGGEWLYGFTTVEPGEGYRVKVNTNTVLTIYPGTKGKILSAENEAARPVHFIPAYTGNGLDHMNIYIEKPEGVTGLSSGDEIGVYDGDLCVGSVVVDGEPGKYISVTVSFDDPATVVTDGFIEGNDISLRLWDNETAEEKPLEKIEVVKGHGMVFERMGTVVLKAEFEKTADFFLRNAYPNPSHDRTIFTLGISTPVKVKFEILDFTGTPIKTLINDVLQKGEYEIEWDNCADNGNRAFSGIYFYRLIVDKIVFTEKLIIDT